MKTFTNYFLLLILAGFFSWTTMAQNGVGFDGVDDFIDCGTDPSLNITGDVTVEAWIFLNGNTAGYIRMVEKDWASSYFLGGGFNNMSLGFGMDPNNTVGNIVETGTILTTFRWIHVAGTWDGATLRIYVNGEEVASKPWVNNSVTGSANSTKIGRFYGAGSLFFNGYMDEVRIWNEARSATQLRENMYKELDNPASETTLVAYYGFNEGSGQTSADLSANSNTAVMGGTMNVETSDPTWGPSTCPIPYYTIIDGNWTNNATWATGQNAPTKDWARVLIKHDVTVNSNENSLEVTVDPAGTLTIDNGFTFAVSDQFSIKSTSAGTGSMIDNGTFTAGNSTVERYFAADEWHLISSPISDGLAGIFTGMYLQKYNETTAMWSDVTSISEPLNEMQGYALWIPISTTYTAEFSGTLNTGNQSRGFTANNPFGWNLMGNPYPSSIDWDMVVPVANMNSAVYYLDAASGNYVSYVGGVGASRYIPPMQGFWISATGNGTLAFTNSDRSHTNKDIYYKNESDYLAVIKASGFNLEDKLYIRFSEETTQSFDGDADAWKFFGGLNDQLPQLFSYTPEDEKLSIDSRPFSETVPAGFNSMSPGEYTLSLGDYSGFAVVKVEDLATGTMHDLMASPYTFSYVPGDPENRFVFHFETLTAINDLNQQVAYTVWSYNSSIKIDAGNEEMVQAMVYNLNGQLLAEHQLHQGVNSIPVERSGNYIVKVIGSNGVKAQKIFVK